MTLLPSSLSCFEIRDEYSLSCFVRMNHQNVRYLQNGILPEFIRFEHYSLIDIICNVSTSVRGRALINFILEFCSRRYVAFFFVLPCQIFPAVFVVTRASDIGTQSRPSAQLCRLYFVLFKITYLDWFRISACSLSQLPLPLASSERL